LLLGFGGIGVRWASGRIGTAPAGSPSGRVRRPQQAAETDVIGDPRPAAAGVGTRSIGDVAGVGMSTDLAMGEAGLASLGQRIVGWYRRRMHRAVLREGLDQRVRSP